MSDDSIDGSICIIGGMPRASTTFLYHTLEKHPSCFVPNRKELEFFSLNEARGRKWYLDFFSALPENQTGFDISPLYFFSSTAAAKIKSFFHRPRVILIVRDPAEFAVSFYKNRVAADGQGLDFDDFVNGYRYVKDGSPIDLAIKPGVIKSQLESFCTALGDELLLIDFRAVEREPVNVLSAIERFCGIEPYFTADNFDNVKVNASDQLNIQAINKLMHKKWFADLVTMLVPKKLILAVRYRLQTSKRTGQPLVSSQDESRYLSKMRNELAQDIEFVNDKFSGSPFVLGSGKPFGTDDQNSSSSD